MRDYSLLQQKKQQWAKEKEELSKLNNFFTATSIEPQFERTSIRTYYSKIETNSSKHMMVKSNSLPHEANYHQIPYNNGDNKDNRNNIYDINLYENQCHSSNIANRNRAPMLPPIGQNDRQKQSTRCSNLFTHQNTDDETSGYLSDRLSPLMFTNQFHQTPCGKSLKDYSNYIYPSSSDETAPNKESMKMEDCRKMSKHQIPSVLDIDDVGHETDFSMPKTPLSVCSDMRSYASCLNSHKTKEERAKWGDRHHCDMTPMGSSIKSDGPCWLERGLIDSGDESVRSFSYIRGQNAPIDPNILAERTTKRIKALELQNAIKAQVEERERLRRKELETSLMEERRLEESLRHQRESYEMRYEEEQRLTRERLEREERKQEIMCAAIEKAREEAELDKAKKKRSAYIIAKCELPKSNVDNFNQSEEFPFDKSECSRSEAVTSSSTTKQNESPIETDDEKFLIGSPIRMKKKSLNKTYKMPASVRREGMEHIEGDAIPTSETNVDGIALVLQTIPPILPISSNDIINLNQNINNLNTSSIQLAAMLTHQMQQLNNITQNNCQSQIKNNQIPSENDTKLINDPIQSDGKQFETTISNDACKQCTKNVYQNSPHNPSDKNKVAQLKDAATVTDTIATSNVPSNRMLNVKIKRENFQVTDASTQTDRKQEFCFQCRYHLCQQNHHVNSKDSPSNINDVKTISVNNINSKNKCSDSCAETKDLNKLEDRPKWGVNRPLQQYVKASERDPFYLRNKRKKHQKQKLSVEENHCYDGDGSRDNSNHGSRSTSPSPSIITNSTVILSSPVLVNSKRSICTEILPIKTDMNGRVYLNFNAASMQFTEDDERSTTKQRFQRLRMTNRSKTANK